MWKLYRGRVLVFQTHPQPHNPPPTPTHTHYTMVVCKKKTNTSLSKKDQHCFPYFSALVKFNPLPHKKKTQNLLAISLCQCQTACYFLLPQ